MKTGAAFFLSLNMFTAVLSADLNSEITEFEPLIDVAPKSEIAASELAMMGSSSSEMDDLKMRVSALEKAPNTLPPYPHAKNGIGLFFTGEALLWRAREEGLDYAITGQFDLQSQPAVFVDVDTPLEGLYRLNLKNGKTHEPRFHWDWGFRVGAGYDMCHDGWDVYSTWTRYHHGAKSNITRHGDPNPGDFAVTGGSGRYISPFWVAQLFSSPGLVNRAKARWHLDLDLADLELGRNFLITRYLSLRPYVGLRSAWIDQKYNLSFLAFNFPTEPTVVGREISVRMKNDFWGMGLKAGLNTQWFLGRGFSIYGNGSFSLLDGHYHIRYKLHDQKPVTTTTITGEDSIPIIDIDVAYDDSFKNKKRIHTIAPMACLALGLRWEKSFSDEQYQFGIWGGYEQNVFFGQNQFMNFQNDFVLGIINTTQPQGSASGPNYFTDRGNLALSGFTGGVSFAF